MRGKYYRKADALTQRNSRQNDSCSMELPIRFNSRTLAQCHLYRSTEL